MPSNNKKLTSIIFADGKVLNHSALPQRTRGGIDCTVISLSYDACCDSGVLCQFRQALAHLHKYARLRRVLEPIRRVL